MAELPIKVKSISLSLNSVVEGATIIGPKGEDAVNPFKGWWNSLADLKAAITATQGDYAYIFDASPATTASIYVYSASASGNKYWADSGHDVDASAAGSFASGQTLNTVNIIDDTTTGGSDDVLSAEQGKKLGASVAGIEEVVTKRVVIGSALTPYATLEHSLIRGVEFENTQIDDDEEGYVVRKYNVDSAAVAVSAREYSTSTFYVVYWLDDGDNFIGRALPGTNGQTDVWTDEVLAVPSGATQLWMNVTNNLAEYYVVKSATKEYYDFGSIADGIKSMSRGFIVDRNHIWDFYSVGDSSNEYKTSDTFDTIFVAIPNGAKRVHTNIPSEALYYYYFTSYDISNDTQACFRNRAEARYNNNRETNGADFVPYYLGDDDPVVLLLCVRKSSLPSGFSYDGVDIYFDIAARDTDCESSLNGKKVSVLGDSISSFATYTYWMDGEDKVMSNRYPAYPDFANNNVISVEQMWWKRLFDKCGAQLEAGNCIGSSSISDNDLYNEYSYLDRYADLGDPDVIIIEGFHNEPQSASCTFNPSIATSSLDTTDVGQAYDKLIRLLKATYPDARIVDVLVKPEMRWFDVSKEIDEYYGIERIECLGIDYTTILTDNVHPDSDCMERIADYVAKVLADHSANLIDKEYLKENTLEEKALETDDNVAGYVTDRNGSIIARIGSKGDVDFYGGGGFLGEKATEAETDGYIKLVTSKNGVVVGGIKPDGTVKIFKAEIDNFQNEDVNLSALLKSLPVIAAGLDNIRISNDKRVLNLLTSSNMANAIEIPGNDIKGKLRPCISIIDDDTIDYQIPVSWGGNDPVSRRGGYFSLLLPMMLSLGAKHGKSVPYNLASEGHRVGLTPMMSSDDTYSVLNENGRAVKFLAENFGWNVINHSMTAQLPVRTYFVDGIDSELADTILANGYYKSALNFNNTIVLDRLTGKWYEVNSDCSAWVERTPTKKYAQMVYRQYINPDDPNANHAGPLYINRDFDFDYNWGEWFKRAEELGLPFEKVVAFNGHTTFPVSILASRKYSNYCIGYGDYLNYPPIKADVSRGNLIYGDDNVKDSNDPTEANLKALVDECIANNSWLVFTTHAYDVPAYNYYVSGKTYPESNPTYPSEWEVPLKHDEIQDIIGDNAHDYLNNPPSRLGIQSWEEWTPAPGTKLKVAYDVLDYALGNGVDIVTLGKGWELFGNMINIGVDRNGKTYAYDTVTSQTPYTDEEQSFLTIGADGSIRYYSK